MKKITTGRVKIDETEFDSFIYLYNRFILREKNQEMRWKGEKIGSGAASIIVNIIKKEQGKSDNYYKLREKEA